MVKVLLLHKNDFTSSHEESCLYAQQVNKSKKFREQRHHTVLCSIAMLCAVRSLSIKFKFRAQEVLFSTRSSSCSGTYPYVDMSEATQHFSFFNFLVNVKIKIAKAKVVLV